MEQPEIVTQVFMGPEILLCRYYSYDQGRSQGG
jgi:hypothetical protein